VACLFGEAQGRVVVSCPAETTDEVLRLAGRHEVPARRVGTVRGPGAAFRITVRNGSIDTGLEEMAKAYFDAIPTLMERTGTGA
jgi:hypothetical protein